MASKLFNFIIDNFLSKFIEVNKSETYTSLWSGILELKNLKIKKESFSYINLPYFILESGYIGKIKIELKMPFFYSNPINIYISDIFLYSKQKDINNLNEEEEIKIIKDSKSKKLLSDEEIFNKLEEIKSEEPSLINQIINNINIEINNFVLRFEDSISNPENPFAFGIILKNIKINSANQFYEVLNLKNDEESEIKENNNLDFTYKVISINDLYVFLDCIDSLELFNYDKLIDLSIKENIPSEMVNYLGDILDFYCYCKSELNIHYDNKELHDFIFDKFNIDIKISMNSNLENNNPKYELYIDKDEDFIFQLNIDQLSNMFYLLSYYNLFSYYQLGLLKTLYNITIDEKEKTKYILDYMDYYYKKYYLKLIQKEDKTFYFQGIDNKLNYKEIQKLRKIATNNLHLYIKQKEIENKINNENNRWFFSPNLESINNLNNELLNIKNELMEHIKYELFDKYSLLLEVTDNYLNLPDSFVFYNAKINIKKFHFIINEKEFNNNDINNENIENNNEILDFFLEDTIISYTAKKYSTNYSIIIKDFFLTQKIVKSYEYDKIIIAKSNKEEERILLEYQTNKDELGNIINKVIFNPGMQIYLFINIYIIQYINTNILSCFSNSISFFEMSEDFNTNISKCIRLGYILNEFNKENEKKKKAENCTSKYEYNINLKEPIMIIPQDIFDNRNNKCLIISAEEIIIKSDLIDEGIFQRTTKLSQENNINESNSIYESCLNDSNIMDNVYDKQILYINGIQLYLSDNCVKEDNYKVNENIVIHYFNLSVLYKTLINAKDYNNIYNNSCLAINIKDLYCSIDEFQILFLLSYLRSMKTQNEVLKEKTVKKNKDKFMEKYNDEYKQNFIEKMLSEGIILKDEYIIKKSDSYKINLFEKKVVEENDFYKNSNKFFFELTINEIKLVVYKIYPDLTKASFIQLKFNKIQLLKFNNKFDDSLMKLYLKSISLEDKDQDIKKNFLLPKKFQLLIQSNNREGENCITYSSLFICNKNENITNIEIKEADILASFDSLTRIYIFSIYYFGIYQDIQYSEKNNKKLKLSRAYIKRISKHKTESIIKEEKIVSKSILKFKLVSSYFRIPFDEKDIKAPIFSTKLNIFYEQSHSVQNQNIYDINNETLLRAQLLSDDKNMNLIICESDFDIIYLNPIYGEMKDEKIITNYRIQFTSQSTFFPSKNSSISNMNICVEPLIITCDLYQFKYTYKFYNNLMNFLFISLYKNYVPYLRPEDIVYVKGKPIIIKKTKTLSTIIRHVIEVHKIKKKIYRIYEIRKKKKYINENLTNSFNSISFQLDKVYVRLLDNNKGKEKRILLSLEISKIFFNKINNSNPKDKTNVSNELISIISNSKIDIDKYIIHNLYKYMNCKFSLELYYYNLEYSDFEPIMEPINVQYLSYQTDKIFRNKTFINIENIININISTNCIKVLNIFISKYMKEHNKNYDGNKEEEIRTISNKKNAKILNLLSNENKNIEEQEEIVLKISNQTGLFIYFWFDFDKENKMKINNKEVINLSDRLIYKTRKNKKYIQQREPEKNTFSFRILNYENIQKINFNKTNCLYFKTKINDDENDKKYLFYSIKINTSSLIKEIIFESSIIILNETIFDELILSIDDEYIKDNKLTLVKNKKIHIPLTWIISSKRIFLQNNKNSEKVLIYNDISEIIFADKLTSLELKEKQKKIENTKTFLENKLNNYQKINLHHPKYKDYISTYVIQRFNQKNSKIISVKNQNNEKSSFFLDYCSSTDKDFEISSDNNYKNKNNEKIYQFLEYTTKSLEYILLIRPISNFTNYTPFNITCSNNKDNSNIIIKNLKTVELYDEIWLENNSLLKFQIIYDNEEYETDFINLNNNNFINTIYLSNKQNKIIRCNISHNLLTKAFNEFNNELEQYSILSYNYIIYFDFIINNRMGYDLYGLDIKDIKNIENNAVKFNKDSLSVFSSDKEDIQKLLLSLNNNKFNSENKVNVNALNLENTVEMEEDNTIYNILCKASNSLNYIYSTVLLFEPKYILINDLDFSIYFQQINESNKPIDEIKKLEMKKEIPLIYKKEDKIIFKIGIKANKRSPLISYSGLFELDNSIEYDLKVEIDQYNKSKYPKNSFYMSNKLYLYFRVKNKITDEGNIYLFITFPEFPILEIDNRTSDQIKIYETKSDEPIIINSMSKIPFIWKNNVILKSNFICEIEDKKIVLSFSHYEKKQVKIGNNKYVNIYNHQKNALTGTRCLTFESVILKKSHRIFLDEKVSNILESYKKKKIIKTLNKMNVFIKGIGLSFLDEAPKEIFYISFYEIRLIYSNSYIPSLKHTNENHEIYEFYLKNFQIDSSLNNPLKTLIYPKNQNIPSLETEDPKEENKVNFISLLIEKSSNSNIAKEIQSIKYPRIDLCIQEINIKIDQVIIMDLFNLIKNYTSKLEYFQNKSKKVDIIEEEESLLKNIKIPLEELKNEKKNANKILINYLFLSAVKINLSFRLDLSSLNIAHLPKYISNIIGSLGSSLVRISDSPIRFSEKIIENIYLEINQITKIIIDSYIKQSIFQVCKILGSTDIIGNPVQLIEKIGTGFFEFVNEPRKGLLQGPSQFGKGIVKGVGGLLNGVVGGAFDSVSKISGTLYNLVQSLTGKNNDLIIDEENEPTNIIAGASKGLIDGFEELKKGFTGLVLNPIETTSNVDLNPLNFVKGLGIGIVGFVVSPVNFVLKIGNSFAVGTKNTFNYFYNKVIKNQRFRFPRYIKENSPLTIYDPDLSAAKEFLFKLLKIEDPIILYFSQFVCENRGYDGKIAYSLLTNELFLLLSDEYNIFLNINTSEIKDIELKYNSINFEFIFSFEGNKSKVLLINKISNIFACELYSVLVDCLKIKKNQVFRHVSFRRPYVKRFKKALKDNIEKNKVRMKERPSSKEREVTIENNNSFYYVNGNEISEEELKEEDKK